MGRNFERPAQSRQIAVRRVALQYPTKAHACACLNAVQRVGALPHGAGWCAFSFLVGPARSAPPWCANWRDPTRQRQLGEFGATSDWGVAGTKTSCYAFMMTAKKLKDVL